jgi:hypothetical protein
MFKRPEVQPPSPVVPREDATFEEGIQASAPMTAATVTHQALASAPMYSPTAYDYDPEWEYDPHKKTSPVPIPILTPPVSTTAPKIRERLLTVSPEVGLAWLNRVNPKDRSPSVECTEEFPSAKQDKEDMEEMGVINMVEVRKRGKPDTPVPPREQGPTPSCFKVPKPRSLNTTPVPTQDCNGASGSGLKTMDTRAEFLSPHQDFPTPGGKGQPPGPPTSSRKKKLTPCQELDQVCMVTGQSSLQSSSPSSH